MLNSFKTKDYLIDKMECNQEWVFSLKNTLQIVLQFPKLNNHRVYYENPSYEYKLHHRIWRGFHQFPMNKRLVTHRGAEFLYWISERHLLDCSVASEQVPLWTQNSLSFCPRAISFYPFTKSSPISKIP
jgi:hypothetical protein